MNSLSCSCVLDGLKPSRPLCYCTFLYDLPAESVFSWVCLMLGPWTTDSSLHCRDSQLHEEEVFRSWILPSFQTLESWVWRRRPWSIVRTTPRTILLTTSYPPRLLSLHHGCRSVMYHVYYVPVLCAVREARVTGVRSIYGCYKLWAISNCISVYVASVAEQQS
jgi:hypothetical protein